MGNPQVREWLDSEWNAAMQSPSSDPDPEIDALANSKVNSIRYALITQLLGKIADPRRSLIALQLREAGEGAWDARSFATAVVLPWERANHQILGKSPDPYASKPLRRPRLDDDTNVRDRGEWERLLAFFVPLETAAPEQLRCAFSRVLQALVRRLVMQSFAYPIPQRLSQAHLESLVTAFLGEPSGGLRPLAVSSALFRTFGEAFQLFSEIRSQGINEADSASDVPGDITCFNHDGNVCLVVEVKDTNLTLSHIQEASLKAKQSGDSLANFLFAVPGVRPSDAPSIRDLTYRNWAEGLNIYHATIPELLSATLVLLDESWRVRLVREIGSELDDRGNQLARRAWFDQLNQEMPQ